MKAAVVGASEYAGRHTLRALTDAIAVEAMDDLEPAFAGCDVVMFCAPTWEIDRKLKMTRRPHPLAERVLEAARGARVRRLVHLSSTLVYGPDPLLPTDEGAPPRPAHAFEKLKLAEESWLRRNAGDVEVVIVRAAVGFGAHDSVLGRMLRDLERGQLRLVGGGHEPRTFLAGSDLGRALAAAAVRGRPGATYLAGGFEGTWREMFEIAAHVLRVPARLPSVPYDLAFLGAAIRELRTPAGAECWPNLLAVDLVGKPHVYDGARTRRELVWSPQVGSFDEGVGELCAWYREEFATSRQGT